MIVVIVRASSLTASRKAVNICHWQTASFDILQHREGGGPQYLNVGPEYQAPIPPCPQLAGRPNSPRLWLALGYWTCLKPANHSKIKSPVHIGDCTILPA